jgi:hypothetical protein
MLGLPAFHGISAGIYPVDPFQTAREHLVPMLEHFLYIVTRVVLTLMPVDSLEQEQPLCC